MIESDWQRYFGVGDLQSSPKVGIQAIDSVQKLAPGQQLTKIQPSTSAGLLILTLTPPYTGFQGTLNFMPSTSATPPVITFSTSGAGNIMKSVTTLANQITSLYCDGTNWFPIGSSSS